MNKYHFKYFTTNFDVYNTITLFINHKYIYKHIHIHIYNHIYIHIHIYKFASTHVNHPTWKTEADFLA